MSSEIWFLLVPFNVILKFFLSFFVYKMMKQRKTIIISSLYIIFFSPLFFNIFFFFVYRFTEINIGIFVIAFLSLVFDVAIFQYFRVAWEKDEDTKDLEYSDMSVQG